jgi:hypothetical protein
VRLSTARGLFDCVPQSPRFGEEARRRVGVEAAADPQPVGGPVSVIHHSFAGGRGYRRESSCAA